ncbi:MAG: hypothetical protein J6T10_20990 [Methanobrevibacter sp.]|nr:hypothetical protein [Methanobrevibacter sp.]
MKEIVEAIQNIGFPIVCTIVLFSLYNKTITSFKDSIDKNTEALTQLQSIITKRYKTGKGE